MGACSDPEIGLSRSAAPRGSDPRQAAFEILRRVESGGAYASVLLERAEARLPDPRDGALLHELVLGVLRNRALLDHALSLVASRPIDELDPPVREALRIGAYALLFDRVPDFAAVDTAVTLVLRNVRGRARASSTPCCGMRATRCISLPRARRRDIPFARFASHPEWWVGGGRPSRLEQPAGCRGPTARRRRPAPQPPPPRHPGPRLAAGSPRGAARAGKHAPRRLGRASTSTFRTSTRGSGRGVPKVVQVLVGFGPRVADTLRARAPRR
jgi:transcription termination factor NusB